MGRWTPSLDIKGDPRTKDVQQGGIIMQLMFKNMDWLISPGEEYRRAERESQVKLHSIGEVSKGDRSRMATEVGKKAT